MMGDVEAVISRERPRRMVETRRSPSAPARHARRKEGCECDGQAKPCIRLFDSTSSPFSAIDGETEIFETRRKTPMKSAALIFDGLSDGMQIFRRNFLI
jgi:hypothetical protein